MSVSSVCFLIYFSDQSFSWKFKKMEAEHRQVGLVIFIYNCIMSLSYTIIWTFSLHICLDAATGSNVMYNQLCKWLINKLSADAHVFVYKHIFEALYMLS